MRVSVPPEALREIAGCDDYREFIAIWIRTRSSASRRYGYSDIARRAGFAARSFPRDVALGKKRITLQSLYPFIRGLGLSSDLAEYFRLLVELEHEDCRIGRTSSIQLSRKLENLRSRLLQKTAAGSVLPELLFTQFYPSIYAALGTQEGGADLREISRRLNLPRPLIRSALDEMERSEIVSKRGARYFAGSSHLNFSGLKGSSSFKKTWLHLAEKASQRIHGGMDSERDLFFASSFSVNSAELPRLKQELRSVLLKYVDEAESAPGDQVISIVSAMV